MRPLPAETVERMRRLCEVHSQDAVAAILKVDRNTVRRAKRRGFKPGHSGPDIRPMPADFPIQCSHMTLHQLRQYYRTGIPQLQRWIASCGRDYRSQHTGREQRVRPPVEVIQAALAEHGATKAAAALGVHPNTLVKWRTFYGLPIASKPKRKVAPDHRGWAERYLLEGAAV